MQILFNVPAVTGHPWHRELLSRLVAGGHGVQVRHVGSPPPVTGVDAVLSLESRRFGQVLASRVPALAETAGPAPDLVIDPVGGAVGQPAPVLSVEFSGRPSLADAIGCMLAAGSQPEILTRLDGVPVGRARPMVDDRLWLSRATTDILAGAISLIEQSVSRFAAGRLEPIEVDESAAASPRGFFRHYLPFAARAATDRLRRRFRLRGRPFYWQVGYRAPGDGGIEVLPDDGQRFYADPFVLARGGREYLFVEEFPYALGRGVISVAARGDDGRFGTPRAIVEEPHHLSYPQVFEHDGEVWMIPESGAAGELVLYRAEAFPDRWVRDTVLLDRALGDATLLVRDGRFWLFATEQRGQGSASDTMSVFVADALRGPYAPHPLNPIVIDRAAARPGGAFIARDGRLFLPVQDGTDYYGGGLGLAELLELTPQTVRFAPPQPLPPVPGGRRIHTLNYVPGLEVVDWYPAGNVSA